MTTRWSAGTLRRWSRADGAGVADCTETPGGCWVSASVLDDPGSASLRAGQPVEVEWERSPHGEFAFRATRLRFRDDLSSSPGG